MNFIIIISNILIISNSYANPCRSAFDKDVEASYHRALFERDLDPFRSLSEKYPDSELTTFEDQILSLIMTAPEYRDIEGATEITLSQFARQWNLSKQTTEDVLMYWGLVFYGDLEIAGGSTHTSQRLKEIGRIRVLSDSTQSLIRNHRFYLANLRQLSVPEMAQLLNISEGQVRQELSLLNLSIVKAWNEPVSIFTLKSLEQNLLSIESFKNKTYLDVAKSLLISHSTDQVAQILGVGRQALEFIRHHLGQENRGVSWDRILEFSNQGQQEEVSVLLSLYHQEYSHQQIADTLNQLAKTILPTDPNYRTAASVSAKLLEIGVGESYHLGDKNIDHPQFGKLKKDGKLVPENASIFIRTQILAGVSLKDIANELDISESGLRSFMQRNFILKMPRDQGRAVDVESVRAAYSRQREDAALRVIRVMRSLGNQMPKLLEKSKEQVTADEWDQRLVYNWIKRNRNKTSQMEKLPEDLRLVIENYPWREFKADAEFVIKVMRSLGNQMPKLTKIQKDQATTEEWDQQIAFDWIRRNRNKTSQMEKLPEDLRQVIENHPWLEFKADAEFVIKLMRSLGNQMPKFTRKPKDQVTAEEWDQHLAYDWIIRNRNKASMMAKLPQDLQDVIKVYFTK